MIYKNFSKILILGKQYILSDFMKYLFNKNYFINVNKKRFITYFFGVCLFCVFLFHLLFCATSLDMVLVTGGLIIMVTFFVFCIKYDIFDGGEIIG